MPRSSDVVVVGAGIIGCAVAYELARRGVSVQVIDGRPPGMGATQASAGVLAPYIEAEAGSALLELTVRSLDLFDAFVARVAADSGIEVPYHRTGTLDVAAGAGTMTVFRERRAMLEARGVEAELVDRAAVRAAEPQLADEAAGALLIPAHGFVAAGALTRALVAAGRSRGARWADCGAVRRIARADRDVAVTTERGQLTAGEVVLAAGSWSGRIEIEDVTTAVPVRPVRGQLLYLAWKGPSLRRVTWSEHCYLVPWSDGTVLVGATVEDVGFDERTTAGGVRDLLEAACRLVPQAGQAGFLGARAGLRPRCGDDVPVIGRSERMPNVTYATGHYRNGVLLAPLTAVLVADALLGGATDPALRQTSPQRFGAL